MKRILSGITPSSSKGLHLGNFFGAVKPHLEFQEKGECFFFVADLHSLNSVFSPSEVSANSKNIFIEYLSFGIDPQKTTFYLQSDITPIPYLQNILNNVVTVSELARMHAYKDKLQKETDSQSINFGLFSYPVLMASDILMFEADIIPVGEDQAQHVEIAREIAKTFNNRYGEVLKVPELYVKKEVAKVPGTDGLRKMSKSLGNDISIFEDEEIIKKQIMSIVTDPARIHPTDPGDPAKNPCFAYLNLLNYNKIKKEVDPTVIEMMDQYKRGTIGDVTIKRIMFNTFMEYFSDVRAKKRKLERQSDTISDIRTNGSKRANEIANKTLEKVKKAIGIW
jgi:tryptophanyl-tRNA synthetase